MQIQGQFRFFLPNKKEIVIPNTITLAGWESYLKMMFHGDTSDIAVGGNFYIGLCDQVPVNTDTLGSITTEPTSAGTYARKAITRDITGWPTIDTVNGRKRIISQTVNFAASGADFSAAFSRAFLCNAASGSTGVLYSYSGPLGQSILLTNGQNVNVQYEVFVD